METFTLNNITVEAETLNEAKVTAFLAVLSTFEEFSSKQTWALSYLNAWRGQRRATLGLTSAEFQELVYTGKVLECQRWQINPESTFGLSGEAAARGISNAQMAALVIGQWQAWQAASDQIEAAYITARAAVLAAADEAAIAEVLAGLE